MDHSLDQEIAPGSGRAASPPAPAPPAAVDDGSLAQASSRLPTAREPLGPADARVRLYAIWGICGFLLLAVGLVFGQTLCHEFIGYDDQGFVYENPHVTPGLTLPGIWWALTEGSFGEWYPLADLSHMLDCQLYGLHPAGHYLTNVLLHAASAVLLFLALLRMSGDLWPSAWVAAVFAIHPLHVESVAWVAERRDMLSGLFFMLTLLAYARYAERPSLGRYLPVAGCLALGLMSKPMLVTVPFVLLLVDYWPLDRFRSAAGPGAEVGSGTWLGRLPAPWRLVVEKGPLLALAAASCGITIATHSSLRSTQPGDPLSLATRVANALVSYATYLGQSLFPINMAPYYPHLGPRLPIAWVGGSLALLVAISAAATYGWRRRPYLIVGWLWFLGMLVPVLGLVTVGTRGHARADRYLYLSQIGLSIVVAWGVWAVYRSRESTAPARWRRWMLAVASGGSVLALAAAACRQASYWRDAETLWTHALACTDSNLIAHSNLAHVCLEQDRTEEAIAHLREAVAAGFIYPDVLAMAHLILADLLREQGSVDEALAHYEQTVRLFPSGELGHTRFALALAAAGRPDRAIVEWRESIRLSPALWSARIGLASALLAIGDASGAADECREVIEQEPRAVEAILILASALAEQGQVEGVVPLLERALELDPGNARAHFRLGRLLYDRGQSESALAHLNAAIRLEPEDVPMLWQTAWIMATSPDGLIRDGGRAVERAKKAVELSQGQESRALDALAAALAETEEFSAAAQVSQRASTLAALRGDEALAGAIRQRTRLYRQRLPYREPAPPSPASQ